MATRKISVMPAAAAALSTHRFPVIDPALTDPNKNQTVLGSQITTLASPTILASVAALYRNRLTANTTYNVPATYATLELALTAASQIDFNGFTLTIQLANGTYSPGGTGFNIPVTVGQSSVSSLIIRGDPTTPSNVVLSHSGSFNGNLRVGAGTRCRVTGVQFQGGGNTFAIRAIDGGNCEIVAVDFGTGHFYHRFTESGGVISSQGAYSISASANAHAAAANGGYSFDVGSTITLTGTPAWTSGYANADALSFMQFNSGAGTNFSGAATGPRFSSTLNSVILSGGGGATFLPGNSAGSTATGGLYS